MLFEAVIRDDLEEKVDLKAKSCVIFVNWKRFFNEKLNDEQDLKLKPSNAAKLFQKKRRRRVRNQFEKHKLSIPSINWPPTNKKTNIKSCLVVFIFLLTSLFISSTKSTFQDNHLQHQTSHKTHNIAHRVSDSSHLSHEYLSSVIANSAAPPQKAGKPPPPPPSMSFLPASKQQELPRRLKRAEEAPEAGWKECDSSAGIICDEQARIELLLGKYYKLNNDYNSKEINNQTKSTTTTSTPPIRLGELPSPLNVQVLIMSWYPPILKLSWQLNVLAGVDLGKLNFYQDDSNPPKGDSPLNSNNTQEQQQQKQQLHANTFNLDFGLAGSGESSDNVEETLKSITSSTTIFSLGDNSTGAVANSHELNQELVFSELKRRRFLIEKSLTCFQVTYNILNSRFKVIEEYPPYLRFVTLERLQPATEYSLQIAAVYLNGKYRRLSERIQFISPTDNESRRFKENTYRPIHRYPDRKPEKLRFGLEQVRSEELTIVAIAIAFWLATIYAFFNKWGKIRMLEPYQPAYRESASAALLTTTAATTAAAGTGAAGGHHHHPSMHNLLDAAASGAVGPLPLGGPPSSGGSIAGLASAGNALSSVGLVGMSAAGKSILASSSPIGATGPLARSAGSISSMGTRLGLVPEVAPSGGQLISSQQPEPSRSRSTRTSDATLTCRKSLTAASSGLALATAQLPVQPSQTSKLLNAHKRFETLAGGDFPQAAASLRRTDTELGYLFQAKAQALAKVTSLWSRQEQFRSRVASQSGRVTELELLSGITGGPSSSVPSNQLGSLSTGSRRSQKSSLWRHSLLVGGGRWSGSAGGGSQSPGSFVGNHSESPSRLLVPEQLEGRVADELAADGQRAFALEDASGDSQCHFDSTTKQAAKLAEEGSVRPQLGGVDGDKTIWSANPIDYPAVLANSGSRGGPDSKRTFREGGYINSASLRELHAAGSMGPSLFGAAVAAGPAGRMGPGRGSGGWGDATAARQMRVLYKRQGKAIGCSNSAISLNRILPTGIRSLDASGNPAGFLTTPAIRSQPSNNHQFKNQNQSSSFSVLVSQFASNNKILKDRDREEQNLLLEEGDLCENNRKGPDSDQLSASNKLRRLLFISKSHQHHHIATSASSSTLAQRADSGQSSSGSGQQITGGQNSNSNSNSVSLDSYRRQQLIRQQKQQQQFYTGCDIKSGDQQLPRLTTTLAAEYQHNAEESEMVHEEEGEQQSSISSSMKHLRGGSVSSRATAGSRGGEERHRHHILIEPPSPPPIHSSSTKTREAKLEGGDDQQQQQQQEQQKQQKQHAAEHCVGGEGIPISRRRRQRRASEYNKRSVDSIESSSSASNFNCHHHDHHHDQEERRRSSQEPLAAAAAAADDSEEMADNKSLQSRWRSHEQQRKHREERECYSSSRSDCYCSSDGGGGGGRGSSAEKQWEPRRDSADDDLNKQENYNSGAGGGGECSFAAGKGPEICVDSAGSSSSAPGTAIVSAASEKINASQLQQQPADDRGQRQQRPVWWSSSTMASTSTTQECPERFASSDSFAKLASYHSQAPGRQLSRSSTAANCPLCKHHRQPDSTDSYQSFASGSPAKQYRNNNQQLQQQPSSLGPQLSTCSQACSRHKHHHHDHHGKHLNDYEEAGANEPSGAQLNPFSTMEQDTIEVDTSGAGSEGQRPRMSSVFVASPYTRAHRDSFAMLRALSQKKSKSAEDVAYLSSLVLQIWIRDRNTLLASASSQQALAERRRRSTGQQSQQQLREHHQSRDSQRGCHQRPKSSLTVSHLC